MNKAIEIESAGLGDGGYACYSMCNKAYGIDIFVCERERERGAGMGVERRKVAVISISFRERRERQKN